MWDLAVRDLPASGMSAASAWQLADRLWFQSRKGSGGNAYNCALPSSDGCGTNSWFHKLRVADDDDGNLNNGTPHAAAIFPAFKRHNIACGTAADASNRNSSACPALAEPTLCGLARRGRAAARLVRRARRGEVPRAAQRVRLQPRPGPGRGDPGGRDELRRHRRRRAGRRLLPGAGGRCQRRLREPGVVLPDDLAAPAGRSRRVHQGRLRLRAGADPARRGRQRRGGAADGPGLVGQRAGPRVRRRWSRPRPDPAASRDRSRQRPARRSPATASSPSSAGTRSPRSTSTRTTAAVRRGSSSAPRSRTAAWRRRPRSR